MPKDNQELFKKVAIVAGCTAAVAGATYFVYKTFIPAKNVNNPAEALKNAGNKLFQQKKYKEAVEKFDEALIHAKDMDNDEFKAICNQNAAACLDRLGRIPEAIIRCTEALKFRPKYLKAIIRRANLHAKLGEDEECLRDFAFTTMIDAETKFLDGSFKTFEKAHRALTEKEINEIALQRSQGIDFPIPETSVIEWLEYSVVKDPVVNAVKTLTTINDRYDSILSLIKHKKYDLVASVAAEETQKEDSEFKLECLYITAKFYTFHNNPKKVTEWLDKFFAHYESLDEEKKNDEKVKAFVIAAYNIRASVADSLEEADLFVKKAEEIDSTNTDPRFGYAMLAILNKQLDKATEALQYILKVDQDHPYVKFYINHFEFTKACESQNMSDMHKQIIKMEQLIDSYPKAPIFTYTVLSNIHTNSGSYRMSLDILNKGLKAYPDLSEFIMLRTLTEAKCNSSVSGNVDDMTQMLIDLCKRDPNNFEAQATYAKICSGKKEYDQAIESFERAIMLARQPAELQLAVQELVLARAGKEAQYVWNTLQLDKEITSV